MLEGASDVTSEGASDVTFASSSVSRTRYALKRAFDATLASILLVVLSPLLALVGLVVRLDSRGPALFVQQRVGSRPIGRNGELSWERTAFDVYKFRSMFDRVDESAHREYIAAFVDGRSFDGDGERYKISGDPRVTRVGKILRRTSIDELPQLFNVLKGDMSLVGPRPVPPYEVEGYSDWHFERFNALPGMTGYWQVHGRGVVPFDEMMMMDIHYVRNQSLWLDLKLLAMTLPAVLLGRGAG
jgi:lipopolysaccharide/colanic/teichoic acid biosynthesis glycosyltransferase